MKAVLKRVHLPVYLAIVGVLCVAVMGCPRPPLVNDASANILLKSSNNALAKVVMDSISPVKAVVGIYDIYSLIVTVTRVTMERIEDDDEDADKGDEVDTRTVVVFDGETDVDLKDLTTSGFAELLAAGDIPSGNYNKIRLSIRNPRLRLSADPNTLIDGDDVRLTANGRVFISTLFNIPEGEITNILLDVGGINLVENGNGRFVLTPQLDAEVSGEIENVRMTGVITSVDLANNTFVMVVRDSEVTVNHGAAAVFLPNDIGDPTGSEADLVVNAVVDVAGFMEVNGTLTGLTIHIAP